MEEWEYCLMWATPKVTVLIKPDRQVERFSNQVENNRATGILTSLRATGWKTVAFDITPTTNMAYLFKRRIRH